MKRISITIRFGIIAALRGDPVVFVDKLKEEFILHKYVDDINQIDVKGEKPDFYKELPNDLNNIMSFCEYSENTLNKVDLQNIIQTVFEKSTIFSPESIARFKNVK